MRILAALFVLLAATAAARAQTSAGPAAEDPAAGVQLFALRDGRTVWGRIEAHDEQELLVRRLEGGGLVHLGWGWLDPAQERELKLLLGYVDEGEDEILIDADRLVLHDGTALVGRIVEQDGDELWLKRANGTVPVPRERVAAIGLVRASALEVYTRAELYQELAGRLAPELVREGEAGARAHVELAEQCERMLDYAHAAEHWEIARALAPGFQPDRVGQGLERAGARAAVQEQVDVLAEADLWRARGQYERAWALLDAFPQRFPGTALLEDWNRARKRVERSQERDLRDAVVESVHRWSERLARDAARAATSFEAARGWAEDRFEEELFAAVLNDLQRIAPALGAAQARALWDQRAGGRFRQASYGFGTWLLGEERALATPESQADAAAAAAAQEGTQEDARKRLEARIRRYLENQEVLRKNQGRKGTDEDPEAFWRAWDSSSRAQWLLADFVESSDVFRLERVRFANCRECGGRGVREVIFSGGAIEGQTAGEGTFPCPTCHTLGRVRRVRYR